MPVGGAETERRQPLLRELGRVDLREPEGLHASRTELKEQLLQTGSTIVDERAERYNLRLLISARHVKDVGLDSFLGGDAESCDVVLPCRERLDRALPADLWISLPKEVNLTLTERYRRVNASRVELLLTIEDPTVWTKPWTVKLGMRPSEGDLIEYACPLSDATPPPPSARPERGHAPAACGLRI